VAARLPGPGRIHVADAMSDLAAWLAANAANAGGCRERINNKEI